MLCKVKLNLVCPWRNIAEELELCYRSVTEAVIHVVCKNVILIGKRTLAFLIVVFLGESGDASWQFFVVCIAHCLLVFVGVSSCDIKEGKGT